ncbi:hypothetical protein BHM03_00008445 [Ensete ventricosum]|nr:hypothetical protein BHM03_00008445 [Ensete ventricosum]
MCGPLHIILPIENQDLSLLNICLVGATFLFAFFPLEVSKTTIPFGLLRLAEQLMPCSAPANALARLQLIANTAPATPFKQPWNLIAHEVVCAPGIDEDDDGLLLKKPFNLQYLQVGIAD